MVTPNKTKRPKRTPEKSCGLCGKTSKLIKTDCCGKWICDDEHKYVIFSFARNSCSRNHRTKTLCAFHHNEEHSGDWSECDKCRSEFSTPEYVWYGTNEFNFRKLDNPPPFDPIRCGKCATVIDIGEGGYSLRGGKYYCNGCSSFPL